MFEGDCIVRLKFPQKLWYLLNAKTGAVQWGALGKTILLNYKGLQQYLQCNQSIFKTSRISSFIRQLNLYGFRKVTSHLQDPLISSVNPDLHEYTHDFFQYGKSDLLGNIRRKTWNYRKDFVFKLESNKSYCGHRVRKARKNFQRILRKTALEIFGILDDDENYMEEIHQVSDNEVPNNYILPNSVNDLSSYQFCLPNPLPDEIHNQTQDDISQSDNMEGVNLSSYIQNFSVSESILEDTSAIKESLESSQYSYWENDASIINDSECSVYCDYISNNTVKVEDVDSSEYNNTPSNSYHTSGEATMVTPHQTMTEDLQTPWDVMRVNQHTPDEEYGSEFKELYIQISKSVDLLNSE